MNTANPPLTPDDINHFHRRGHVVVKNAFSREIAGEWADEAFVRLGYDKNDPSTWKEARIHMPSTRHVDVGEFAPKVWQAACQLLGGEERVRKPYSWGNGMIVNLREGADRPWEPPSPSVRGWHKDGDFFRHFLDSPEQGLLTIVVWTDIKPKGGGTYIACDSVPVVARFLAERPEGVRPGEFGFAELIKECNDFLEVTAEAGDVFLIHPYVLHSVSQNHLGIPRMITNPPVHLLEPMNFNRENPDDLSPVEKSVLLGLGVDRLDFKPTAPRERIVPERVKRQQKMLEEEKARAAAAGGS